MRRRFLKIMLAVLGFTAFGSLLYPLARFLSATRGEPKGKQLAFKKTEIPIGAARDIVFNGTPAIIINRPDGGFVALSRVCTHLGCLVDYDKSKKRLLCPCHAGVYDLDGAVISGLPTRPLREISLKIKGDDVVIG
ncbi:MAG: Rieske (2Fe-2S) protein [Deltaproteobacteria bacterium]|nr:Rieske (2Fe-2S) protein [Deltaproteobacteria bacterium]